MDITTEQYERIIRFLDGDMNAVEMDEFEIELSSNPAMRHQLDFEQSLRNDFALNSITSLTAEIPAEAGISVPSKPTRITSLAKWFSAAAAIIIIILLVTVFWQKTDQKEDIAHTNKIDTVQSVSIPPGAIITEQAKDTSKSIDLVKLFRQYFKKDTLPEEYPIFLAEAFTDYESGNYKTLQQLNLNNLPETRGVDKPGSKQSILQLGHYYKGLAFLQTNNTKDAIINLNWVLSSQPEKILRDKAQWYLALAYLEEKNPEKVAEFCKNIVDSSSSNLLVRNAKTILETLRK